MVMEAADTLRRAQDDRDDWRRRAEDAERELDVRRLDGRMFELVKKRVAGVQRDDARDIITLEFADATAAFVPRADMERCTGERAVMLTAYDATLELIDGRWRLTRLDVAPNVP
jgi:hypothetical protein